MTDVLTPGAVLGPPPPRPRPHPLLEAIERLPRGHWVTLAIYAEAYTAQRTVAYIKGKYWPVGAASVGREVWIIRP